MFHQLLKIQANRECNLEFWLGQKEKTFPEGDRSSSLPGLLSGLLENLLENVYIIPIQNLVFFLHLLRVLVVSTSESLSKDNFFLLCCLKFILRR